MTSDEQHPEGTVSYDRDAVFGETTPADGLPAGAVPTPDPVALTYEAGRAAINAGSHAARVGYYTMPVDDPDVALARVTALEDAVGSLSIAVALLRDATGGEFPELTDQLQAACSAAGTAERHLRDVRRRLPGGAWDLTPDDGGWDD